MFKSNQKHLHHLKNVGIVEDVASITPRIYTTLEDQQEAY